MGAILLAAMVIVQPPVVKLVSLQRVRDTCGQFEACTVFVSYRLSAHCSTEKVEAAVTFQPMIFLHDLHALTHEQLHIKDIREFATAYVTDIEQKQFETDAQCRAEADLATAAFAGTMREFAQRSMRHLH